MEIDRLKQIAEAVLLAAARPLTLDQLLAVFEENARPERTDMRQALQVLESDLEGRGVELVQVASGYRIQVKDDMQPWVSRLWEEKPARYSRALLETLALITYRQPITRGEIEEVRGVSVSTSIMKTLLEREWVRVIGHREVPGHPAMYGTTKEFLDYFNLKSLDEMPTLAELRDLNTIGAELELDLSDIPEAQLAPANDDSETPAEADIDPEAVELAPAADVVEDNASITTIH
ncbi:MAG: SMC-Scp complex subunit ScpB [Pseudomonadota bacterium]